MQAKNYCDWDQRGETVCWVDTSYVNLEEGSYQVHGNGNANGRTDRDVVHDCTVANPSTATLKYCKGESCCTDDNSAWKGRSLVGQVVICTRWLASAWTLPYEKPFKKLYDKDVKQDKHVHTCGWLIL